MMTPEDLPEFPELDPKTIGLYPKYDVIDRRKGELVTEATFVLKPDSDRHARVALRAYATSVFHAGYQALSRDIYDWLTNIDARELLQEQLRRAEADTPLPPLRDIPSAVFGSSLPPDADAEADRQADQEHDMRSRMVEEAALATERQWAAQQKLDKESTE